MDSRAWIESVLARLTVEEKVSLLSGADGWHTKALDAVGVPAIAVTDGPNGARGPHGPGAAGSTPSTCFPAGVALGATWDPEITREVGAALAREVRHKGAHVLLAPTVNLHRTPLAGRNFECFSEDPHLSAQVAVSYIRGLQEAGVGACVKHLVANDSEFQRTTISSDVDERTLRELYLVPFERAVVDAGVWAVMGAYNRVNGTYACASRELLVDLLKEEWGFDGAVISDWFALHDTEASANGGTDLEMPGPGTHFGDRLVTAVAEGRVDEEDIDDKVRRVLRLVIRCAPAGRRGAQPAAAHRELARRAAVSGIVLLTNEPVGSRAARALPFEPAPAGEARKLAVVGRNAADGTPQGGGSAEVRPEHVVQAVDAIGARGGAGGWTVVHEPGPPVERFVTEPERTWFAPLDDEGRGVLVEVFDGEEPAGEPLSTRVVSGATHTWWEPPDGLTTGRFAARWSGALRVPSSGPWRFGVAAVGRARLLVDDRIVVDNWTAPEPGDFFNGTGSRERVGTVDLDAGRAHDLRVEFSPAPTGGPTALRVGIAPAPPPGELDRAVLAAETADAAVVVVGTTAEWESEGYDRGSMALPGDQDELVRRVAAVNDRTVVVVNTGSPVEMPWAGDVAAIVQLWFPGQELGDALADVLFGVTDPGGRLPTTFPVRYEDHPALFCYPGENGRVRYGEGVFMGYRGYAARGIEPRFPFGHGLSYTTFEHCDLRVELTADPAALAGPHQPGDALAPPRVATASVEVRNTGTRPGTEVVQVFVGPPPGRLSRPPLELRAFEKLALGPGESRRVTLGLDARAFTAYDAGVAAWHAEPGPYRIVVASSGRPVIEEAIDLPGPVVLPVRANTA